jgi:hypothetical protein
MVVIATDRYDRALPLEFHGIFIFLIWVVGASNPAWCDNVELSPVIHYKIDKAFEPTWNF